MQLPNDIFIPELVRLVREGKRVQFTPTGISMRPYIEGGKDSVLLGLPAGLEVGDIVLAEIFPQRYVLHRIIGIDGQQVTLMGDGNLRGEEHCDTEHVLAKVTAIISPDGHRKCLTKARLWRRILRTRRLWLKIYRKLNRVK